MLDLVQRDRIVTVRMAHGKVNALDMEFCRRLIEQFAELSQDDSRAVILRGNGRVFCAGIDLKRWLAEGSDYVVPFIELLEQLFLDLLQFPKPLVAAIDGGAIAGGCMIACAADRRLIAPDARIGIPEMRIGVALPTAAVEIIRMVAPNQTFARIIGVGATYVGAEAVEQGLADAAVAADQLQVQAERAAEALAAIPAPAFRITKQQMRVVVLRRIAASRKQMHEQFLQVWTSRETRDAIADYVQNRLQH